MDERPKEYLITQPPMLPPDLNEICQQVATDRSPNIDGIILSNLLKFCHKYALKRNELVNLRIRDVVVSNSAGSSKLNVPGPRSRELSIADDELDIVDSHLNHLKRKRYKTSKTAPLFPARKNEKYEPDKLKNHLFKFFKEMGGRVSLEKIRQTGACSFYDALKRDRVFPKECLDRTAKFLGVDEKQAYGILSGHIQPTGAKKGPMNKHRDEITKYEQLVRRCYSDVTGSIDSDSDLKQAERLILKEELSRVAGTSVHSPASTTPESADSPLLLDLLKATD